MKFRKYSEDLDFRVVEDDGGNYCDAWSRLEVPPLRFYAGWEGVGASRRWRMFYRRHTRCPFERCLPTSFWFPNCYPDSGKLGEQSRDGNRQRG